MTGKAPVTGKVPVTGKTSAPVTGKVPVSGRGYRQGLAVTARHALKMLTIKIWPNYNEVREVR